MNLFRRFVREYDPCSSLEDSLIPGVCELSFTRSVQAVGVQGGTWIGLGGGCLALDEFGKHRVLAVFTLEEELVGLVLVSLDS